METSCFTLVGPASQSEVDADKVRAEKEKAAAVAAFAEIEKRDAQRRKDAEEAEAQRKLADAAAIAELQKWAKQRSEEAMAQQDRAKKVVDEQVRKRREPIHFVEHRIPDVIPPGLAKRVRQSSYHGDSRCRKRYVTICRNRAHLSRYLKRNMVASSNKVPWLWGPI
jgi:flagellar biosynthesis GTPase FlhF